MGIGGMANLFLFQSIVVMLTVVGWQVAVKELFHQHIRWKWCCGLFDLFRLLVKYPHGFIMLVTGAAGLYCFKMKVVLVDTAATPADSHHANRPCVLGGVFDLHDVWHSLSALSLALFVMSLLDVKVHDFARENSLICWREIHSVLDVGDMSEDWCED